MKRKEQFATITHMHNLISAHGYCTASLLKRVLLSRNTTVCFKIVMFSRNINRYVDKNVCWGQKSLEVEVWQEQWRYDKVNKRRERQSSVWMSPSWHLLKLHKVNTWLEIDFKKRNVFSGQHSHMFSYKYYLYFKAERCSPKLDGKSEKHTATLLLLQTSVHYNITRAF